MLTTRWREWSSLLACTHFGDLGSRQVSRWVDLLFRHLWRAIEALHQPATRHSSGCAGIARATYFYCARSLNKNNDLAKRGGSWVGFGVMPLQDGLRALTDMPDRQNFELIECGTVADKVLHSANPTRRTPWSWPRRKRLRLPGWCASGSKASARSVRASPRAAARFPARHSAALPICAAARPDTLTRSRRKSYLRRLSRVLQRRRTRLAHFQLWRFGGQEFLFVLRRQDRTARCTTRSVLPWQRGRRSRTTGPSRSRSSPFAKACVASCKGRPREAIA